MYWKKVKLDECTRKSNETDNEGRKKETHNAELEEFIAKPPLKKIAPDHIMCDKKSFTQFLVNELRVIYSVRERVWLR